MYVIVSQAADQMMRSVTPTRFRCVTCHAKCVNAYAITVPFQFEHTNLTKSFNLKSPCFTGDILNRNEYNCIFENSGQMGINLNQKHVDIIVNIFN